VLDRGEATDVCGTPRQSQILDPEGTRTAPGSARKDPAGGATHLHRGTVGLAIPSKVASPQSLGPLRQADPRYRQLQESATRPSPPLAASGRVPVAILGYSTTAFTTKLYDRTGDEISLDDVERIQT
jgi:hypothetical protein